MNDDDLGAALYAACHDWSAQTDRAMQDQQYRIGVSNIGFCSERLRRQLDRQIPEDTDLWTAFVGSWIAQGIETAAPIAFPDAIIQAEVTLTLKGEYGEYQIPGHPDIILPSEGKLLDFKSKNGFEYVSRHGMDDPQPKYQRHGYGYAAWEAGYFGDLPIEDVRVGNVWHDRSAVEKGFLCRTEPLDLSVIDEMTEWVDDVVYHWQHKQEAQKQPHRNVCQQYCGYYKVCREPDTDVEGLIEDPDLLQAVTLYVDGQEMEKVGRNMKEEAKDLLKGVRGSTGVYTLRWTDVPASEIKPGYRRGYSKLEVRPLSK